MRARHGDRPEIAPARCTTDFFFFSLFLNLNLDFFSLKKVKNAEAYAAERPIFLNSFLKLKIRGL
jgi:hypothetical protein